MRRVTVELVVPGIRLIALTALACGIAGCADQAALPNAPSSLPTTSTLITAEPADAAASTTAFGLNGRGRPDGSPGRGRPGLPDPGRHPDIRPEIRPETPGRSREQRVVGFVASRTADTLIVNGITIVIEPTTIIRHGWRVLTLADIVIGHHVQARGSLTDGTLTATEIKVQPTGQDDAGEVEVSGVVANITPVSACPAIAFDLGTTSVVTTVETVYAGTTCAALANGLLVDVDGFPQPDGSILATRIAPD